MVVSKYELKTQAVKKTVFIFSSIMYNDSLDLDLLNSALVV